jgi:Glycosyl transferase family 2
VTAGLPSGSIDRPKPGDVLPRELVRIRGSALDVGGPPEDLLLSVADAPTTVLGRALPSPGIRRKHPDVPGADAARWEAVVDLRGTGMAEVSLRLVARSAEGGWLELAHADHRVEPAARRAFTRSRAAFTVVQDEPEFLPLWLSYYERFFAPEDIYVLDHESTDGGTERLAGRCNVVPVHRSETDLDWLRSITGQFQAFLLASYETVLYSDVDEFIVADPARHAGLDSYIEALSAPAARCSGFEVVQRPSEPPLRLDSPILAQRRFWHPSRAYSKRLIARAPLAWGQGFHRERRFSEERPDPDLFLIHLHRADYDRCLARHRGKAARKRSEADLAAGAGYQNRIVDAEEFRHWFYNVGLDSVEPEPIPDRLKPLL